MASTKREEIPVSSIVLNVENFRHRPATSQEGALAALFGDETDRGEMLALATDIAARGLDPSSLLILEPVDGYWRVLEGNRRIAAIKVMMNPELLPDLPGVPERKMKEYRAKLAKVGAVARLPRNVLCVVTDDRELANHLIKLKHTGTGAHKGAGTILWDTEGRTRYEQSLQGGTPTGRQSASNRQTASALALLDALAVHFSGDAEMDDLAEAARKKGLTTLGRLLIKAENQLRLGVQIEGNNVRFAVSRDALRTALHRVLSDLGTPDLNSRTTNHAQDVIDYLDKIEQDLPKAADRLASPEEATPPSDSGAGRKPRSSRRKNDPVMRKPFVGMNLYHASDKTRAVLAELKTLRIDDYPYVLSGTIRMLIDLYTADVMRALGKPVDDSPSKRAAACLNMVEPPSTKRRDRKFPRIADALATGTGDLSIDTMNGFMHRHSHNPVPDTIRVQCANYQPFLVALDEYVEAQLSSKNSA